MLEMDRLYLKPSEVAATLRLTPSAVYRMAREGRLPSVRFDRSIRIPAAAFAAWLRAKEAGAPVILMSGSSSPRGTADTPEERWQQFHARAGMTVEEYLIAWRSGEIEDTPEKADLELEALSLRRLRKPI